jgi:hypothetical protein
MTLRRGAPVDSPLSMEEVYTRVHAHAARRALTTVEITEFCRAHHPDYPGITTQRVGRHLASLERRRRVQSFSCTNYTALADHGVDEPVNHARYWALPDTEEPR